ncbi:MAG: carbohydrate-binding family 9-like protein [Fimbriimonadaceae bacterium]|nr:carbohydrate-binding family 9-like protein [Fimbriimonadaceae bacterium]
MSDHTPLSPALPKAYVCQRCPSPPVISGRFDDLVWDLAPWTDDFADILGENGPRPLYRTRAKMLWDDECLYLAVELEDPDLWATLSEHDSMVFQDNDFELFLDPDGDNHLYLEWEINALGTTWDLLMATPYRDGGPPISGFEIAGGRSCVHVRGTLNNPRDRDEGWSLEAAFPWAALRDFAYRPCPPHPGDFWRMNMSRVHWHRDVVRGGYAKRPGVPEENWVWSPPGVVDMHRPERWGTICFATPDHPCLGFAGDPAQPAIEVLGEVYYAQRRHWVAHGSYADSVDRLGFPESGVDGVSELRIEATASLWEASCRLRLPGGSSERWNIRHDSRLWRGDRYVVPNTRPDAIPP